MRISTITINDKSFKSVIKCGEDDIISKTRREFLREQILETSMPHYEILNTEKRLEEYELNKLIASLCGQKINQNSLYSIYEKLKPTKIEPQKIFPQPVTHPINHEEILKLPIFNLGIASKQLNVYRGQTVAGKINTLKALKQNGIERIVDLAGYENLEEACKDLELEYLYYSCSPYYLLQGDMFKTETEQKTAILRQCTLFGYSEKEKINCLNQRITHWQENVKDEIKDFIEFIRFMQKGNLYIGCEYGTYTTDNALMLNSTFNPLYIRAPKFITQYNRHLLKQLSNLYQNLTPEHKQQMNWSKDFDTYVLKKLTTFIK